jgi:hypothetical protein
MIAILSNSRFMHAIVLAAVLPTTLSNCARNVVVVKVRSQFPDYEEKELLVTGRPIFIKTDYYPSLQIDGFYQPNGQRCYINGPVADEVLEKKLDPGKTYRFHLYTSHQKNGYADYYHAMLSKVEDAGTTVIDASICDVHGRQMKFGPATPEDWSLRSAKEQRDLEVYHNHGCDFPSCCSGGLIRWEVWHCPECRRKVDAFKSKYQP